MTDPSQSSASEVDLARLRIPRDDRPPRRWGWWITLGLMVIAVFASYPWARSWWENRQAPEVRTATVVLQREGVGSAAGRLPVLVASGYVVARRTADVGGKVGGRIEYLGVEEGSPVKTNQIIARLEHRDLTAQRAAALTAIEEVEAQRSQAIAQRDEDQRAWDRQMALSREGIATAAALTAAEAAATVSAARVRSMDAALASARARLKVIDEAIENTNVRAPFDGVVIAKRAEVGETVSPFGVTGAATREGGAIATIADLSELEVETEVSERSVSKLRPGMLADVRVQAYPDVSYPATVRQIFPAADRAKAIVEVRVKIDSPDDRVKPEMTATVTFQEERAEGTTSTATPSAPVILAPKAAIVRSGLGATAWVIKEGRAARRPLRLGPDRLDVVEVASGLMPGETVILNPPSALRDGAMVRVTR